MKSIKILLACFFTFGSISLFAQKTETKSTKEIVVFSVGLHCQDCVNKIKKNISFEKGVKDLNVSLKDKTVTITFDNSKTNKETLKKAIEKLGYEVREQKDQASATSCDKTQKESCKKKCGDDHTEK